MYSKNTRTSKKRNLKQDQKLPMAMEGNLALNKIAWIK